METIEDYSQKFEQCHEKLIGEFETRDFKFDFFCEPNNNLFVEEHSDLIPQSLCAFYLNILNGYKFTWIFDEEANQIGSIDIWPVENLFNEKNLIKVEGEEVMVNMQAGRVEKMNLTGVFRIVDYFAAEAQVGYFTDSSLNFSMFFVDSDHEFWALHLDFFGYFQLACEARGFEYWQRAILFHDFNNSYHEDGHDNFIESMPEIFPDFKIEAFFALYNSLKLKS